MINIVISYKTKKSLPKRSRASRTLLCCVSHGAEGTGWLLEPRGWNPRLSTLKDPGLGLFLVHAPDLKLGWISLCSLHKYQCNETRFLESRRASVSPGLQGLAFAEGGGLGCVPAGAGPALSVVFILSTFIPPYQGWSLGFSNVAYTD